MGQERPRVNAEAQKDLDRAAEQIAQLPEQIREHTDDVPLRKVDFSKPMTNPNLLRPLSQAQINGFEDYYIKPSAIVGDKNKFNERFRREWEFDKQKVAFIAENHETKDIIEMWTKPYSGVPAEFWEVPVGVPIWGPRYLAEQIKRKNYTVLKMDENKQTAQTGMGTFTGSMISEGKKQRLDAHPVNKNKTSIFISQQ
jgi:hypothetical protein